MGLSVLVVAVISPHLAGKIQRRTNEKASYLKRVANWLWNPLTWIAKSSIEVMRKIIILFGSWGKKVRRKFSADKEGNRRE